MPLIWRLASIDWLSTLAMPKSRILTTGSPVYAGQDADTGMPFLVMELLSGEELQKVVESQGPLPPATSMTRTICSLFSRPAMRASALDKAHTYVLAQN